MTRVAWSMLVLAAMSAAGIGGYRIGRHGPVLLSISARAAGGDSPVIYYQDPDGKPFYSAEPKSTSDGRPYRAVHTNEDISFDSRGTVKAKSAGEASTNRKILYYRNPMGLPDISKLPKKDAMGMDYIPVYEGEDEDGATVKLSPTAARR